MRLVRLVEFSDRFRLPESQVDAHRAGRLRPFVGVFAVHALREWTVDEASALGEFRRELFWRECLKRRDRLQAVIGKSFPQIGRARDCATGFDFSRFKVL